MWGEVTGRMPVPLWRVLRGGTDRKVRATLALGTRDGFVEVEEDAGDGLPCSGFVRREGWGERELGAAEGVAGGLLVLLEGVAVFGEESG